MELWKVSKANAVRSFACVSERFYIELKRI